MKTDNLYIRNAENRKGNERRLGINWGLALLYAMGAIMLLLQLRSL